MASKMRPHRGPRSWNALGPYCVKTGVSFGKHKRQTCQIWTADGSTAPDVHHCTTAWPQALNEANEGPNRGTEISGIEPPVERNWRPTVQGETIIAEACLRTMKRGLRPPVSAVRRLRVPHSMTKRRIDEIEADKIEAVDEPRPEEGGADGRHYSACQSSGIRQGLRHLSPSSASTTRQSSWSSVASKPRGPSPGWGTGKVLEYAWKHVCTIHVHSRTDQRGSCRPKPRLGRSTWLLAPLVRKWRKETGLASPEPIDTRHLPQA